MKILMRRGLRNTGLERIQQRGAKELFGSGNVVFLTDVGNLLVLTPTLNVEEIVGTDTGFRVLDEGQVALGSGSFVVGFHGGDRVFPGNIYINTSGMWKTGLIYFREEIPGHSGLNQTLKFLSDLQALNA